ncbi:Polyisoprenoid-binding protein YceI [Catalinimonas alkaloidigena]|uniref:Polyisoprenoid-binding protein YceI n=1 Tax=Catalinimonas alkaloidigena TaxID=1075417 RepID=A0A1G9TI50_9BACT|nr:YceI family protein [Catalinimonas alkaloidigena]SDM47184.1 Polyisoprenoid-binding protein YceI [Catalinimonas alkaloidigena]
MREALPLHQTWVIDPVYSRIRFEVRYLDLAPVTGWFTQLEGVIRTTAHDFQDATAEVILYADSVDTAHAVRDAQLRSADFFDVTRFPVLRFRSTSVTRRSEGLRVAGLLDVKDTTLVTQLLVQDLGRAVDPYGNTRAGFSFQTIVNRRFLHLDWNQVTDAGQPLLSEEVQVYGDLQLLQVR